MTNYRTSRIMTVALTLVLIAVVIAAVISFVRIFVFPNTSTTTTDASKDALLSSLADRAVVMKVRGGIVADELFRSYQIEITPNSRILTAYKGYAGDVLDQTNLNNNIPAFEQFIYALYHADMVKGSELTGDANDTRGVCAAGQLYEFKVLKGDKPVKTLWTTSCSNKKGSLSADVGDLEDLFISQIPDSDKIINELW